MGKVLRLPRSSPVIEPEVEPFATSVYDGRRLLGHIVERPHGCEAYREGFGSLGRFNHAVQAVTAILQHYRGERV